MEHLADNLIEDEAEQERLMAKPICFIIVGRPVTHKYLHTFELNAMLTLTLHLKPGLTNG